MGLVSTVRPHSLTPSFSRALAVTRWEYRGHGPNRQMPGPEGSGPASATALAILGPIGIYRGRRKRGWDRVGICSTLAKFHRSLLGVPMLSNVGCSSREGVPLFCGTRPGCFTVPRLHRLIKGSDHCDLGIT